MKKRKCEWSYRKTRNVDLKADFNLDTKIFFDNLLEKRAIFIINVFYRKFTRQKRALLKALFALRSRYYQKVKMRKFLLQIIIIFYFNIWEYFCINSGSWMSRDPPVDTHPLKQAIIKSHIKNVYLNLEDFANYRPISNLSFTSKLLERSALVQLSDQFESNALLCAIQSN